MSDIDVGEDEVGALPRLGAALRLSPAAKRRVIQASPAAGAAGVGIVLPLGYQTVTTTTSITLQATVEEPMALEDLVLDLHYSDDWDGGRAVVQDIRVGTRSLLAGTEELPAGLFASSALKRPMIGRGIVVRPGKTVTVTLAIVGGAASTGSCTAVGAFIGSAR